MDILLAKRSRPAANASSGARCNKSRRCSFTNDGAFEFGESAEHMKNEAAARGGRVDVFGERAKTDLPLRQHLHRLDQLFQGAREAIQLPDHQRVPSSDMFGIA